MSENTEFVEGEALGDDLAPAEPKHLAIPEDEAVDSTPAPPNTWDVEPAAALDDVPENADELVGDEVEPDYDPDEEV